VPFREAKPPCSSPRESICASFESAMARSNSGHGAVPGSEAGGSTACPATHIRVTCMRFCVSVPVLSEQM
jgi:hypothetical protein